MINIGCRKKIQLNNVNITVTSKFIVKVILSLKLKSISGLYHN